MALEFLFSKTKYNLLANIGRIIKCVFNLVLRTKAFHFFEIMEIIIIIVIFCIFKGNSLLSKIVCTYISSIFSLLIPIIAKERIIKYSSIFWRMLKKLLLLSSFTTFIVNQYTFSLWLEMILVPLVAVPNITKIMTENYFKVINKQRIISISNLSLFIISFVMLYGDIHGMIININSRIQILKFFIEYFGPIIILIVNSPVFFVWRYINMIDLQMQKFKYNSTFDYVKYLLMKLNMRIKIDVLTTINWDGIFIKTGAPMCYKILLTRKFSYKGLVQIIRAAESMAIPNYVCKDSSYKRIPIRIDVYYKKDSVHHIATWIEPWLKDDERYSFVDDNLRYLKNGLYVNLENT